MAAAASARKAAAASPLGAQQRPVARPQPGRVPPAARGSLTHGSAAWTRCAAEQCAGCLHGSHPALRATAAHPCRVQCEAQAGVGPSGGRCSCLRVPHGSHRRARPPLCTTNSPLPSPPRDGCGGGVDALGVGFTGAGSCHRRPLLLCPPLALPRSRWWGGTGCSALAQSCNRHAHNGQRCTTQPGHHTTSIHFLATVH
jgi:hypothetical protein